MPEPQIRELEREDAAGAAALFPEQDVTTAAGLLHRLEEPEARAWVAEEQGVIVGTALARLTGMTGRIRLHGIARDELLHRAERHLLTKGAIRMTTFAPEAESPFFELRGFTPGRRTIVQSLEPEPAATPEGVTRLRDLAESEQELYELWAEAEADASEPGAPRLHLSGWRSQVLGQPDLSLDGSFVALDEGRPAAFTLLVVDPLARVGLNAMTGTRQALRGRGLATAVKRAAAGWAGEAGLTHVYAGNDERNAAILAVNRKLGYRPVAVLVNFSR